MTQSLDRYIGLPYRDKGRDRDGLDCWGLVVLVYREVAGIELPSYAEDYRSAADDAANAALIAGQAEPWIEVPREEARPLDIVTLLHRGRECHVGIVARRGHLLHVGLDRRTSCIEPFDSALLRNRIARFARHEQMP